jgi:hypothetical protein
MYLKMVILASIIFVFFLIPGLYIIFFRSSAKGFCGDNVCEYQENYMICPQDCSISLSCPEDIPQVSFQIYNNGRPTSAFKDMGINLLIYKSRSLEYVDSIDASLDQNSSAKFYCSDGTANKLKLSNYYNQNHVFRIKRNLTKVFEPKDFFKLFLSTKSEPFGNSIDIITEAPLIRNIKPDKKDGTLYISVDASMDWNYLNDSYILLARNCSEYVELPVDQQQKYLYDLSISDVMPTEGDEFKIFVCKNEGQLPLCERPYDILPCRKVKLSDIREFMLESTPVRESIVTNKITLSKYLSGSIKIENIENGTYSANLLVDVNTNIIGLTVNYMTGYFEIVV